MAERATALDKLFTSYRLDNDMHLGLGDVRLTIGAQEKIVAEMIAERIMQLAREYAAELEARGYAVLVDDREESPGRKFNDADLIGIPRRITIGQRNLAAGNVEIKIRQTGEVQTVAIDSVMGMLRRLDDGNNQ